MTDYTSARDAHGDLLFLGDDQHIRWVRPGQQGDVPSAWRRLLTAVEPAATGDTLHVSDLRPHHIGERVALTYSIDYDTVTVEGLLDEVTFAQCPILVLTPDGQFPNGYPCSWEDWVTILRPEVKQVAS